MIADHFMEAFKPGPGFAVAGFWPMPSEIDLRPLLRALEEAVVDFAGCAVVVSHDRWFLDRIATHIIAFEGNSHVEFFTGNYADYEIDRRRRLGGEANTPHRIKFRKLTRA